MGAALKGMLCEIRRTVCSLSPQGGSGALWHCVCGTREGQLVAAGTAETVNSADFSMSEKRMRSRRWCLGEDAPFEEFGKGELCRGVSERDTARSNLRRSIPKNGGAGLVPSGVLGV